jgi:Membrane-fusion protein
MSAEAEIVVEKMKNVLLVPRRAVAERRGRAFVRVLKPDGRVEPVPVTLGPSDGVNQVVLKGLTEGERVVLVSTGTTFPAPGAGRRPPLPIGPRR